MKSKKRLIVLISIVLVAIIGIVATVILGSDKDRDNKGKDDADGNKPVVGVIDQKEKTRSMLYKYINNNLVYSTSTWLYPANPETGVFSALVKDFDGNNSNEMVTFSLEKDSNGYWSIVLDYYTIDKDSVIHGSESEPISLSGAGNYQLEMCAVSDGNKIRVMKEGLNGGGATYVCQYVTYEVQNGALVKLDEYFLSEYYRYGSYQYEEMVSGTTYSSAEEFIGAVADAGYETTLHSHIAGDNPEYDIYGDVDVYDAECFGGDHIFSLLDSAYLLGEERLGYLHDNTEFSVQMAEVKANENEEDASDSTVEITDEDYYALCELVNYSIRDYDCESDTAVTDAYYIIMDVYGPYESFYDEETRVDAQDPNGEFPFTYHYKFPAGKVDWLLENVYNVSPDHNLIESNGEFTYVYYQDDYYYMCPLEKGFVRDFPEVVETKLNADGKYEIRLKGEVMDNDYEYIDVVAELKYIDGEKVWSVYKITVSAD